MNSQIDEFERIMLDYLKGEISSEDMQKLTILLKRENACREKYREIARSYALASSSWFARRKEQNFEQLCDTLNFYSSRKHSFFRKISVWRSVAIWTLLIGCSITFFYLYHSSGQEVLTPSYCQIEVPQGASSKLLLPDSTIVFLNGGTVLSMMFLCSSGLTGKFFFQVRLISKFLEICSSLLLFIRGN